MRLLNAHESKSAFHAVLAHIRIIEKVNRRESSYLSVILGDKKVDKTTIICQKCMLLCIALKLDVENMSEWFWNMRCKRAIQSGERIGIIIA